MDTLQAQLQHDDGPRRDKIECVGINKDFGTIHVLQDVNLSIPNRQFHSLLGPSGCGKTTLLRIIAGLVQADAGSVAVDGDEVVAPRHNMAMVFQMAGLFPWKSLYDNVAFGLLARGAKPQEIREIVPHYIEMVGLKGFERALPYQLSGGMRQRAGLARAFAVSPEVLLMDEPFAAVDAQTRETLQAELLQLWEMERKTVVFVTHSIDEALILSDYIWVMGSKPGRIREGIPVAFDRPRNKEEIRLEPKFAVLRQHIGSLLREGE